LPCEARHGKEKVIDKIFIEIPVTEAQSSKLLTRITSRLRTGVTISNTDPPFIPLSKL
jgi:hypothetical protein